MLNDGIRAIGFLDNARLPFLSIPASLNTITDYTFNYAAIKVLEFRDYKSSKILNNKESIKILVENLYKSDNENQNGSCLEKVAFLDNSLKEPIILNEADLDNFRAELIRARIENSAVRIHFLIKLATERFREKEREITQKQITLDKTV